MTKIAFPTSKSRGETVWSKDRGADPAKCNVIVWRPSPLLAPGYGTPILSITFGPIVGSAEHLAVLGRTFAALAPCGNVVGVHFLLECLKDHALRSTKGRAT